MRIARFCDDMWGRARLICGLPEVEQVNGAVYLPFSPGKTWGIFDQQGVPVEGALDRHGPDGRLHGQEITTAAGLATETASAPEEVYIYGGNIHFHYGHFILNTLSRSYATERFRGKRVKVLMHGPGPVESWFYTDFVREALSGLMLDKEDIATFDQPTLINRLIVPYPAFQEQSFIYQGLSPIWRKIGAAIVGNERRSLSTRPVYYVKSSPVSKGWMYPNEQSIIDVMAAHGVEIIHPEKLSLRKKIALHYERQTIFGIASSGMHTSVFTEPNAQMVALNPNASLNTNFPMLDMVNNNSAQYLYNPKALIEPSSSQGALWDVTFPDAAILALDMLDAAN